MASKGQSTIDIGVNVTGNEAVEKLNAVIQGIRDNVDWINKNGLNIKVPPGMVAGGASGLSPAYSAPPPGGSPGATGRRTAPRPTGVMEPGSAAYNAYDYQHKREGIKFYKSAPKTFEAMYSSVTKMSTSLTGLSTGLMRLGGVGTLAAAPVAASAFALDRAGRWRERQARAQAFGLTPYQEQAFANNLKMYTGGAAGTQALFSGLLQQQTTIGGPQFLRGFLRQWGVKTTGKETTEESAENVLRAERKIATTTDPSMWQTYSTMFPGMGDVTDIPTMMRFKSGNVTEQQLNADIARARSTAQGGPIGKSLVEISQQYDNVMIKVTQGLDTFADKLAGTGLKIEKWVSNNFEIVPAGGKPQKMKDRKWTVHIDLDAAEKAIMDTFKGLTDWWSGSGANLPSKSASPESFDQTTFGNQFLIPGTNDKIEKLNKNVVSASDSLDQFSRKLLATSNIMVGGSGAYLAARAGASIGAAGGFVTTIGPGGAPISAAGIAGGGGGFAGSGDGRGAPGGVVGRGTGGAAARPAKGALKANQQEAYKAAIASGLSDSSARALVANMSGEALSDPGNVHWDVSHTARGIVQWDPERSEAIKRHFGKMPNEMSVADQTKAAIWEMQNNPKYKASWDALQGGGSTEEKIGTLVRNYERPRDTGGAIRARVGFAKGFTPGGASNNWGIKDNEDVLDHLKYARDKGLITNEQCVSLATASVGIRLGSGKEGANVHDWRKGNAAEAGGLKPGTPIATFLDKNFNQSNFYAGGGSGTPGAHKDHAAVFESYIRDKNGKIIGMDVDEQYKGSKGVHAHQYMFGKGRGEGDAANYYGIDVASGGHLGGAANPLTQRDAARGSASKPHIGDMSQYHNPQGIHVKVTNMAGADVVAQTTMLGSAQGNYG